MVEFGKFVGRGALAATLAFGTLASKEVPAVYSLPRENTSIAASGLVSPNTTGPDLVAEMEEDMRRLTECVVNDPQVELKKMIAGINLYKKRVVRPTSQDEDEFDKYKLLLTEELKRIGTDIDRSRTENEDDLAIDVAFAYMMAGITVHTHSGLVAPGNLRNEMVEMAKCYYISAHTLIAPYAEREGLGESREREPVAPKTSQVF